MSWKGRGRGKGKGGREGRSQAGFGHNTYQPAAPGRGRGRAALALAVAAPAPAGRGRGRWRAAQPLEPGPGLQAADHQQAQATPVEASIDLKRFFFRHQATIRGLIRFSLLSRGDYL